MPHHVACVFKYWLMLLKGLYKWVYERFETRFSWKLTLSRRQFIWCWITMFQVKWLTSQTGLILRRRKTRRSYFMRFSTHVQSLSTRVACQLFMDHLRSLKLGPELKKEYIGWRIILFDRDKEQSLGGKFRRKQQEKKEILTLFFIRDVNWNSRFSDGNMPAFLLYLAKIHFHGTRRSKMNLQQGFRSHRKNKKNRRRKETGKDQAEYQGENREGSSIDRRVRKTRIWATE